MDKIVTFFNSNTSFIAIVNCASVLSLFVTIYVSFKIKTINNFYIFKIRVPEHIKKLNKFISQISENMNDYSGSSDQIDITLGDIESELKSLKRKMNFLDAQPIYRLLREINNYSKRKNKDLPYLRKIYVNLSKTIAQIDNLQKDKILEK